MDGQGGTERSSTNKYKHVFALWGTAHTRRCIFPHLEHTAEEQQQQQKVLMTLMIDINIKRSPYYTYNMRYM